MKTKKVDLQKNAEKMIKAKNEVLNSKITEGMIWNVINLPIPKEFKRYAAKEFLNETEEQILLKYTGIPDRSEYMPDTKENSIYHYFQNKAFYAIFDGSRLQNRCRGSNNIIPGIHTTYLKYSGKWGNYCPRYTADFLLLFHRTERKILYSHKLPEYKIYNLSFTTLSNVMDEIRWIDGEQNYSRTRASQITFPLNYLQWDEEQKCFYETIDPENNFHIDPENLWVDKMNVMSFKIKILDAFKTRREQNKQTKLLEIFNGNIFHIASKTTVTVNNSIASGNCPTGTAQFKEKLEFYGLTENNQANGLDILLIRNDSYTRRAIFNAAIEQKTI